MTLFLVYLIRCAGVIYALIIAYLAFANLPPGPYHISDKLNHIAAFFVLACCLDYAQPRQTFGVLKWVLALAYGLFIEGVQALLPYREFSLLDLAADALGVAAYAMTLTWQHRIPPLAAWRLRMAAAVGS